jgi:hypothetical protein
VGEKGLVANDGEQLIAAAHPLTAAGSSDDGAH